MKNGLTERGLTERGLTENGFTERGLTERGLIERGLTDGRGLIDEESTGRQMVNGGLTGEDLIETAGIRLLGFNSPKGFEIVFVSKQDDIVDRSSKQ